MKVSIIRPLQIIIVLLFMVLHGFFKGPCGQVVNQHLDNHQYKPLRTLILFHANICTSLMQLCRYQQPYPQVLDFPSFSNVICYKAGEPGIKGHVHDVTHTIERTYRDLLTFSYFLQCRYSKTADLSHLYKHCKVSRQPLIQLQQYHLQLSRSSKSSVPGNEVHQGHQGFEASHYQQSRNIPEYNIATMMLTHHRESTCKGSTWPAKAGFFSGKGPLTVGLQPTLS